MTAVAETLGVSRSHLHDKVRRASKPRGAYRKPEDDTLLPLVRRLVDERPTYGYRRITALANRELARTGEPIVNHKRVFRIMRQNGMLLARHTGRSASPGPVRRVVLYLMATDAALKHPVSRQWCGYGQRAWKWADSTQTYEHTIGGLLQKRAELFNEAERIRDRLAEIKNDVGTVDRILSTFGYTGYLDAEMPRQKRQVIFGRWRTHTGHSRRATWSQRGIVQPRNSSKHYRYQRARDRKFLSEHTKRVSKALRILREENVVRSAINPKGNVTWALRALTR